MTGTAMPHLAEIAKEIGAFKIIEEFQTYVTRDNNHRLAAQGKVQATQD